MCDVCGVANMGCSRPEEQPLVDSLVSLPRSLTAENGAKALLIGEFHEFITTSCPVCDGDEDYIDGCTTCHAQGYINRRVTVEWDTIKRIYAKVVEHFAS